MILDGHNRYYALQDLSVPINESIYEIRNFGDPLEEKLFIIRSQLNRRHATPYHRVENALPLLDIEKAKAADRRTANLSDQPKEKYFSFGKSTEVIGRLVGLSHKTVERALYIMKHGSEEMKERLRRDYNYRINNAWANLTGSNHPSFEPKKRLFDVWSIASVDLEKPFGDPDYPGAIPGDIVANVLMWFLPEGGKVVDPMAGGGVTEDVCRLLGSKYEVLLYDNFSLPDYKYRGSITFNDILTGKLPEESNGADLIFADPPYGPQKEYGMNPEDLLVLLRGLAKASWDVLNLGGVVSVLMQNYYRDDECVGEFVPLIRRTAEIMEKAGFTQIFEATVPLYGKVARSEDHMTHIDRGLMVFQKQGTGLVSSHQPRV